MYAKWLKGRECMFLWALVSVSPSLNLLQVQKRKAHPFFSPPWENTGEKVVLRSWPHFKQGQRHSSCLTQLTVLHFTATALLEIIAPSGVLENILPNPAQPTSLMFWVKAVPS